MATFSLLVKEGTDKKDLFQNWSLLISNCRCHSISSFHLYTLWLCKLRCWISSRYKIKTFNQQCLFYAKKYSFFNEWRKSNTDLIAYCLLIYILYWKKVEFRKINSKCKFDKDNKFKMYNLTKIMNSKWKFNKDNRFKM